MGRVLPRKFYDRDAREVAPELLNKLFVAGSVSGRIVEVEAYAGALDPGSHAFNGLTKRNASMFGKPGLLYVYFTYGMHWCANVVCGPGETATAVLLRAVEPINGITTMRRRRPLIKNDRDLCRGPARLCSAFGITGDDDGIDLLRNNRHIKVIDDGVDPPTKPLVSPRIGLSRGADLEWRYVLPDSRYVSR